MDKKRKDTGADDRIKFDLSEEAQRRTNDATSQSDLPEPRMSKEDLPQADQKRFKDGVYSGTGTGAGPGGSTDTGGADTSTMSDQARLGTTDRLSNQNDRRDADRTGNER